MPEKKSYEKNNWPFVNSLVFFLCVSTGQQTEEGHCSADPGEERAAGGASSEERWY